MSAMALLLVSCDPSHDENGPDAAVTSEQLTQEFQMVAKSQGNNNLTVYTSPSRYIRVYSASTDTKVGEGTSVTVQVVPPAGEYSYYIETMNQDGTTTKSQPKSIAVSEFTDLPAIFNDIFGDGNGGYTARTWTWDTEDPDGVWGNGAYLENTGPGWWKVYASDIDEQAVDKGLANDGLNGWMTLSLSGVKTSRGETGMVSVTEDVVKTGWDVGTMTFSGTIPLMGVLVNYSNQKQYEYHILKADENQLRLCAPEPGSGDWGTAWFWNFKRTADK